MKKLTLIFVLLITSHVYGNELDDEMNGLLFKKINLTTRQGQVLLEDSTAEISDNKKTIIIAGYVYDKGWFSGAKHKVLTDANNLCIGLDYEKALSYKLGAITQTGAKIRELYTINNSGEGVNFSNNDIKNILDESGSDFETLTVYKEIICMKDKSSGENSFAGVTRSTLKKQYEIYKFNNSFFDQADYQKLKEALNDETSSAQDKKKLSDNNSNDKKVDISSDVIEAMSMQL